MISVLSKKNKEKNNMKNTSKNYQDPFELLLNTIYGLTPLSTEHLKSSNCRCQEGEKNYHKHCKSSDSIVKANLIDNKDNFSIEISAPGFNKEELSIELKEGLLSIKGDKSSEIKDENKNYFKQEFKKTSFERAFIVPENITEDVDARFENGILYVSLKKKELPKDEPKKIEIK